MTDVLWEALEQIAHGTWNNGREGKRLDVHAFARAALAAAPPPVEVTCWHGTSREAATAIRQEGFNADTWFALDPRDAVGFGGPYLLGVRFDVRGIPVDEVSGAWQFHHPDPIKADRIIFATSDPVVVAALTTALLYCYEKLDPLVTDEMPYNDPVRDARDAALKAIGSPQHALALQPTPPEPSDEEIEAIAAAIHAVMWADYPRAWEDAAEDDRKDCLAYAHAAARAIPKEGGS